MEKKLKLLSYPLLCILAITQLACITCPSVNGRIISTEKSPPFDKMHWKLFYKCKGNRANTLGYAKPESEFKRFIVKVKKNGSFEFPSRNFFSLLMDKRISLDSSLYISGQKSPVFDYPFKYPESDADSTEKFTLNIEKKKIEILFSDSTREKIIKAMEKMDYIIDEDTSFQFSYSSGYYTRKFKITRDDFMKMNSIMIDDYMAWPHLQKTITDHYTLIMNKNSRRKGNYYRKVIIDYKIEKDSNTFRNNIRLLLDEKKDYSKFYSILKQRSLSVKLLDAIKKNMFAAARALLNQGADPDFNYDYTMPMISAIDVQNPSIVRILLKSGAKTDVKIDCQNETSLLDLALKKLCNLNKEKKVSRLKLKNSEKIVMAVLNKTGSAGKYSHALALASQLNRLDYVKLLMRKGADVNYRAGALNPLQWAAKNGNIRIVKYLTAHGAFVSSKKILAFQTPDWGQNKESPLSLAAGSGNFAVIKFLVQACPDKDELARALPGAINSGNLKIVRYLVEKGADIKKYNPLPKAVNKGDLQTVRYLVEKGAKIQLSGSLNDAAGKGYYKIVRHLTEQGACSYDKNRGLENAIEYDHFPIVKYLVEHGADIISTRSVHRAIRHDRVEMIEYLSGCGIDLNAPQQHLSDRGTPLHYAAQRGKVDIIILLVRLGARFEVRDIEGNTPLYYAARFDRFEAVKYMVEHGADMTARNNDFESPLGAATGRSLKYLQGISKK